MNDTSRTIPPGSAFAGAGNPGVNDEPFQLPENAALLVDFDGLLECLSGDSGHYALGAPWLFGLLLGLRGRCGGALAVVTGRRLGTVDQLMTPMLLAGIGLHGAELRLAFNQPNQITTAPPSPSALERSIRALLAVEPFAGRVPVYVGNEPAATAAVQVVEQLGGVGLPLGSSGLAALRQWLRDRPARDRRRSPRTPVPPELLRAQSARIPVSRI